MRDGVCVAHLFEDPEPLSLARDRVHDESRRGRSSQRPGGCRVGPLVRDGPRLAAALGLRLRDVHMPQAVPRQRGENPPLQY